MPLTVRWERPVDQALAAVARIAADGPVTVPGDPWGTAFRFTGEVAGDTLRLQATLTARPDPRLGDGMLPMLVEGRIRAAGPAASVLEATASHRVAATTWPWLAGLLASVVLAGGLVLHPLLLVVGAAVLVGAFVAVVRNREVAVAPEAARVAQVELALASV